MAMTDPLGDMLTRIRNAQMRKKTKVSTPASKLRQRVLDVLAAEGYIRGYTTVEFEGGKSELEVELKYFDGEPVIREIQRVSKPGRRVYASVKNIPIIHNVWACRSCLLLKGLWPITTLARTTWVVRFCAASSDAHVTLLSQI